MKRLSLLITLIVFLGSCDRSSRGHLVGVQDRPDAHYADPPGMVYIPMGSFIMGPADQDPAYSLSNTRRTVSVQAFYMDETEITNNQYRQFVFWVRDSIARDIIARNLPELNYYLEEDMDRGGEAVEPDTRIDSQKAINWSVLNPNVRLRRPDDMELRDLLRDSMYLPENERFFRRLEIDTRKLVYRYDRIDLHLAASRAGRNTPRQDLVIRETVPAYPDTLAWIHDFSNSYNDPMVQHYFWHPTYDHYPVVGVSWRQARAFTIWRTNLLNSYLAGRDRPFAMNFSLPSEAEWEYASRGGRTGPYPWGGPYTRNSEGCFLANFKPLRGNYVADGGLFTVIVAHYPPNDFGLYDMAGNVSEWTRDSYVRSTRTIGSDLNPIIQREVSSADPLGDQRKVIKGGSWKDIAYFMQVGNRTYEYQDTTKSYIGFRSVQTYPGRGRDDGRNASNIY
jgi:formylglycine-generating enzyme